ncbi:Scr1 family TA system antitoxin-like transcriptional regulator [Streptomyces rhizosphaericus]|uniref:Scr1 family TA system antitoxin-like transcriptional regulator n=1 Tax=Streptomyces rhizosphaericus TaxID=114699 RepID=UPI00142DDF90|nr:Scr1 family TA system antitoxin-like transcriptional regulator [Streptomyces rhizosphaericus]
MSAPSRIRPPREGEAPAAAALVIGAYLRAIRLARGLTGSDAAWTIGCSDATLSRLETGRLHRIADATELLEHYGIVDRSSLTAVQYLLQEPHRHILCDHAPGWLDRLHACLRQADTLAIYSAFSIPHLVRIPAYPADALTQRLRGGAPIRVHPRVSVTADNGEGVTLLLDELALERLRTQTSVWPAQLDHLRQLAASAQGPQVLVVPRGAGAVPVASLMYEMTLHGHELVVEEAIGFVAYYTGDEAVQGRDFLQAALAAGVPFEQAVGRGTP